MGTTTPQNYTDSDLVKALRTAALDDAVQLDVEEGSTFIADYEIDDLRRILEALPDWRAGDAEVIEFEDIRVGDRILIKTIHGSFYEVTVKGIQEDDIWWSASSVGQHHIARIYLMHRPVQHPDPNENPYILVYEYKTAVRSVLNYARKTFEWDASHKHYVSADNSLKPEQITEWKPLKVVDDDR